MPEVAAFCPKMHVSIISKFRKSWAGNTLNKIMPLFSGKTVSTPDSHQNSDLSSLGGYGGLGPYLEILELTGH